MNRRLISVLFFALVVAGGTSYLLYRLILVRVQSQGHTVAANKLVVAKHDLQVVLGDYQFVGRYCMPLRLYTHQDQAV